MVCRRDTKWKYLRETSDKYFNERCNTELSAYLQVIYPCNQFRYRQLAFTKEEVPVEIKYHRYVCDAICDELKLVIEFDGVDHYMNSVVCLRDRERDEWFRSLGFYTVRIPYWIQLSNEVVKDLFHVEVSEPLCELNFSFYCPETKKVDMNILPGNMCELGRERFIREFNNFSQNIRRQILLDLLTCLEHIPENLHRYAFPQSISDECKL